MLNVNRLRVLIEVARRGSFSAAADALSYTQSAVSQQIAALEAETGMTLLERRPRGVQAHAGRRRCCSSTPRGSSRGCTPPRPRWRRSRACAAGSCGWRPFPTAGATLMPLAIAIFRAAHPEVELTLAEGEPEEIAPRLSAGEFDLALLFEFDGHERVARARPRRGWSCFEDPMFLALPRRPPARAAGATLRLEDLRAEAWIQTSASSPCARHVVRSCHAAGFEPIVSFESDDYQTVQGLVAAGVGVALIPKLALSGMREDIASARSRPARPYGR